MSKIRIIFEVDTVQLFDRLHAMRGGCGPIGERIVGVMMTGQLGVADAIGMAVYGVSLISSEKAAPS